MILFVKGEIVKSRSKDMPRELNKNEMKSVGVENWNSESHTWKSSEIALL